MSTCTPCPAPAQPSQAPRPGAGLHTRWLLTLPFLHLLHLLNFLRFLNLLRFLHGPPLPNLLNLRRLLNFLRSPPLPRSRPHTLHGPGRRVQPALKGNATASTLAPSAARPGRAGQHLPQGGPTGPLPGRSRRRQRPLAKARWSARLLALLLGLAGGGQALAWDWQALNRLAAERAARPWQDGAPALPPELAGLSYDQYRDIRFKPERRLWRAQGLPFEAAFFHVGRQGEPVRLHEVTPSGVREIRYRPQDYDFGANRLDARAWPDLGHAGLKLLGDLQGAGVRDELLVFLGASYFRAVGAGQRYGLSARGLAIDVPQAEEFPRFTDFWLERPRPGARSTRLWALLDSSRLTGAYAFDLEPGPSTTVTVRARLHVRAEAPPVATLGIAPLTSMFFFGENQPRHGDFRPEVHDSDGLMIASATGEWLWRPLANPASPQVQSFVLPGLRGFGLMQRDRQFSSYEDTEARYELRPSAWVTPLGDWGPGRVELYQFHTPDETHDNVVAYWVPERTPAPGETLELAWRIAWQGQEQQRPPGGWALQSRQGIGYLPESAGPRERQLQYLVDFTGPALAGLPEDAPVEAVASGSGPVRILESLAWRHPAEGTWRMVLRLERLEAAGPPSPIELRAFLRHAGHTLTETWTTAITP